MTQVPGAPVSPVTESFGSTASASPSSRPSTVYESSGSSPPAVMAASSARTTSAAGSTSKAASPSRPA